MNKPQQPTESHPPPPADPSAPSNADAPTLAPAPADQSGPTPSMAPTTPVTDELAAQLAGHPRYRVLRRIGQGGMGAVYLAEHLLMDRLVALKVINAQFMDSPEAMQRFRVEVRAAARLSHPNIVAAYDAEQIGELTFLVMEYIEGITLAQQVARLGPLPITMACTSVEQAAHGLQHAHEQGMIHRDIKPHNLMLTKSGQVKILDFGLARFAREQGQAQPEGGLTGTGVVMGTADYIAPEQTRGSRGIDIRADIYSLGCTLYHLLTDRVPFPEGSFVDKMVRHCTDAPEPLRNLRPDVPVELAAVVEKMMAKEAERRYQTPAEVAAALHSFTGSRPPSFGPVLLEALPAAERPTAVPYRAPTVLTLADETDAPTAEEVRPTAIRSRIPVARVAELVPDTPERERSVIAAVLGGFSLFIGVLALFMSLGLSACCFILGWLTVPFSAVGLILGIVGTMIPLATRRSGLVLPLSGVVVNSLALVVVIVGHIFSLTYISQYSPPSTAPPSPPAPRKIETIAAKELGGARVTITEVRLEPTATDPRTLVVRLRVEAVSPSPINFQNWTAPAKPADAPTLKESRGNPLAFTQGGVARSLVLSKGVYADEELTFVAPPRDFTQLELKLPTDNHTGTPGALVFTIPRAAVKNAP